MTYFENNIACKGSLGNFPGEVPDSVPGVQCIRECQSWLCCGSCSQRSWGSWEPVAGQVFRSFESFMVRFCDLRVMTLTGQTVAGTQKGENVLTPFSWGRTEELSRKADPGEGKVQLCLCWELVSSWGRLKGWDRKAQGHVLALHWWGAWVKSELCVNKPRRTLLHAVWVSWQRLIISYGLIF